MDYLLFVSQKPFWLKDHQGGKKYTQKQKKIGQDEKFFCFFYIFFSINIFLIFVTAKGLGF